MIEPDLQGFLRMADQGNLVLVQREILADLDTPVSAFLKVAGGAPHAFLLESVHGGEKWGRFSLIGFDPLAIFSARGRQVEVHVPGRSVERIPDQDPVAALRAFMGRFRPVPVSGLPRFQGGAVGYFGYDLVRSFEKIPDSNPDPLGLADACFMVAGTLLIFDNLLGKLKVVAQVVTDAGCDLPEVYRRAVERIDALVATLRRPIPEVAGGDGGGAAVTEADFTAEMSREAFMAAVEKAKEYIVAGDILQVVLSQRLSVPFPHPPLALYRALRHTNPSPYLFLLRLGELSLVGSSPEILVRRDGDTITVRPIAGTRPRGGDAAADLALESELLADPKEIAEHIMLVDLGRNDLGRVAETGSVRVTERFVIERYSHVMHIVSNVEARIRPELDTFDLIAATFPAGTVSGAPKIRAMEIIDELEVSRRGPYAGTVGYIGFDRQMDLAITIRTALIKDGRLFVQAGAGIVADSRPEREWEETMNKARAIFRAAELAQRGLE
ncbi:MAG: anthranilate synthase component I [Magnetococcales bacterium]|nr:anthranilate synthase component I [Magnetococcales bacterium]